MIRLVQFEQGSLRRVALVEEPHIYLLADAVSVFELGRPRRHQAFPAPVGGAKDHRRAAGV